MAYDFFTLTEVKDLIEEQQKDHDDKMMFLETLKTSIENGDTVFHEKATDKWFVVPKGQSIPPHLQAEILGTT